MRKKKDKQEKRKGVFQSDWLVELEKEQEQEQEQDSADDSREETDVIKKTNETRLFMGNAFIY
jgi:hypothetical protein